jgi:hypothetical protein
MFLIYLTDAPDLEQSNWKEIHPSMDELPLSFWNRESEQLCAEHLSSCKSLLSHGLIIC